LIKNQKFRQIRIIDVKKLSASIRVYLWLKQSAAGGENKRYYRETVLEFKTAISALPCAGITRVRFNGYHLRQIRHPPAKHSQVM